MRSRGEHAVTSVTAAVASSPASRKACQVSRSIIALVTARSCAGAPGRAAPTKAVRVASSASLSSATLGCASGLAADDVELGAPRS